MQRNLYLGKAILKKKKVKGKPKQGFIFDAASQLKVVEMKQGSLPENWNWYSQNDILN